MTNNELSTLDQNSALQTYRRLPLALTRGAGARVWDVEGKEYIDALAGIAVNSLGHCHPRVVEAIREQAGRLMHISNYFVSEPQVQLAQQLVALSGLDRVFFSNSGVESIEGAIKIARKYAHTNGRGGGIISMERSFHGRTLAAIATGGERMQRGFGPMPPGFTRVPFNDIAAVTAAIRDDTAAVIVEPIQGEGGIHVADAPYLRELRALCSREGVVLIFDEIQCGIARSGSMFAKDLFDVQPDIVTLAKGLGGGFPIGAILSNAKVSAAIEYGDHGSTFGGNPLACAAARATLDVLIEENIPAKVESDGTWFRGQLEALRAQHSTIREIRGRGLMLGVDFTCDAKPIMLEMMRRGVLANATADTVLRLVPPLIISREDLQIVVDVLSASIAHLEASSA
ncbi:MAG: aspartate aminotransferase family protein [Bacteroidetes bacterium]|nr:aspartate aminotransferase family protein [Bacteroidota bacterium]